MLNRLQQQIASRRQEVAAYEMEHALATSEMAELDALGLPDEWPEDLAKFSQLGRDQIAASCPEEHLQTVVGLRDRGHVRGQLRAVEMELGTTRRRLVALLAQLRSGESETPENLLQVGLRKLNDTVADPGNPFTGFSVDVPTLRDIDGVGMARIVLKDKDGKKHPKLITVAEHGVIMVDAE